MQGAVAASDLLCMTAVRRDEGFTLVELLVVMVITGVLAGIAIPTFLGQREKAFRSAMKSDLYSLRMAQESRGVENDPRYTSSIALLRDEGYAQSEGVSEAHIRLVDGQDSYVACVQHESTGEWLVYTSADDTAEFATEDCAPA